MSPNSGPAYSTMVSLTISTPIATDVETEVVVTSSMSDVATLIQENLQMLTPSIEVVSGRNEFIHLITSSGVCWLLRLEACKTFAVSLLK